MGLIADQSAAITTLVDAIDDAGLVYGYQPVPKNDWATFVTSFSTDIGGTKMVAAWTLTLVNETRVRKTVAFGATKITRSTTWLLRGFRSWHEPDSDPAFRDVVESIADALDARPSLGGVCDDHDPATVTFPNDGAAVLLGDVRCHYAEIRLTARRDVTVATS